MGRVRTRHEGDLRTSAAISGLVLFTGLGTRELRPLKVSRKVSSAECHAAALAVDARKAEIRARLEAQQKEDDDNE